MSWFNTSQQLGTVQLPTHFPPAPQVGWGDNWGGEGGGKTHWLRTF